MKSTIKSIVKKTSIAFSAINIQLFKTIIQAIVVLLVFTRLFSTTVQAVEVLFLDDFDSYEAKAGLPPGYSSFGPMLGWIEVGSGAENAVSLPNGLSMGFDYEAGGWGMGLNKSVSSIDLTNATLSVDLRSTVDISDTSAMVAFRIVDEDGRIYRSAVADRYLPSTSFTHFSQDVSSFVPDGGSLPIDLTRITGIGLLFYSTAGGQSTTFKLDNLQAATIPEPSALMLIIGTVALGWMMRGTREHIFKVVYATERRLRKKMKMKIFLFFLGMISMEFPLHATPLFLDHFDEGSPKVGLPEGYRIFGVFEEVRVVHDDGSAVSLPNGVSVSVDLSRTKWGVGIARQGLSLDLTNAVLSVAVKSDPDLAGSVGCVGFRIEDADGTVARTTRQQLYAPKSEFSVFAQPVEDLTTMDAEGETPGIDLTKIASIGILFYDFPKATEMENMVTFYIDDLKAERNDSSQP